MDQLSMFSNDNKNQITIDFFTNPSSRSTSRFHSINSTKSHHTYKHYATTPVIEKLCKILDDELSRLLSDIEFSTQDSVTHRQAKAANAQLLDQDLKCFSDYMQSYLKLFTQNLNDSLRSLVDDYKFKDISSAKSETDDLDVKKLLLICRFSYVLPHSCPNLKLCFINLCQQLLQQREQDSKLTSLDSAASHLFKKKLSLENRNSSIDSNFVKLEENLKDICKSCFK